MLDKNADYGQKNMLATGQLGAVTRLWDKTSRLMNLSGFNTETGELDPNRMASVKSESVDDTLEDLATYAIILLIMRKQKWGK